MDSSGKCVRWQFHLYINNIWVGGNGSTVRLLFKHCFPIVVGVNFSVLRLSRYFSGRSQQQEMEPLCSLREAGPAGPGITAGREGRTERSRVMGLEEVYV